LRRTNHSIDFARQLNSGALAKSKAPDVFVEFLVADAESKLKEAAGSTWDKDIAALAKLSLAQIYHQTNRDADAISIYNELTAKPTTTVPAGLAQLQLAALYESTGKADAAKKIYAQLKDKDAKGVAGTVASQKLTGAPAQ